MILFTDCNSDFDSLIYIKSFDCLYHNGVIVSKEKFKYNRNIYKLMEKRVIFPSGKQKDFLIKSKEELNSTWSEFSQKLNVNRTSLEKSYRYEYCSLPYKMFVNICKIKNLSENSILSFYGAKVIDFNPFGVIGRKALGEKRTNLNKFNISFRYKPLIFNNSEVKSSRYDEEKGLKFPNKLTPELAEEIGMSIGDGFLSNRKYEYRLKGNKNEREYYDFFIKPLYKKLFNLNLNIKEYETTYGFEIASKGLWNFKKKVLGIPSGRKDNIELPDIIRVNDVKILTSFIRGVFDTDGNVYFRTNYGFKRYYPIIQVALLSKELIFGIAEILSMLGFDPYIFEEKGGCWHIYLNGYERMRKYSQLIGWNNPKHLNKVKEWKEAYPELSKGVKI